jgi:hypothetical protein
MRTTAPSADSARPPGQSTMVQVPDTLLPNPTKKTDIPEHPAHRNHQKTPVRRNSTRILRAKMLTTTSAINATLQWKNIHEFHQLPIEHTFAITYIRLLLDHLASNPLNMHPHVLHQLELETADDELSWLVTLGSVLLPPQALPLYGLTYRNFITVPTEMQTPYAIASDILNHPPQKSSENSNHENALHPYWNVIYDPTTDRLQVYANNRVRIYRRQRSSCRFTYLQGKADATFPIHSTIAIGHWENDYFVLVNYVPPPRTYSPTMKRLHDTPQRNSKAGLHVISALPTTSPRRPNPPRMYSSTMKRLHYTPQRNSKAGLHVISALPTTSPRQPSTAGLHAAISALSPTKPRRKKCSTSLQAPSKATSQRHSQIFPSTLVLRNRIPPIAGMLRRHLDSFFAIAEVVLTQNVDPG